ncbi:MAG TPA: YqgE/AlgH family protein [Acidimicrobiales bacterium]
MTRRLDLSLLRGRLLVATPTLADPNFSHTVVLILDHDEEGSLGVVLNRPTPVELVTVLPEWHGLAASPGRVFVGGPVQPDGVLALAEGSGPSDELTVVRDGVGVLDLQADPSQLLVSRVRVFAGYAGWGAGQIQAEIARGDWFVVDATPDDVFSDDPESLWTTVLRRQGGTFTTIPKDPTLN